MQCEVVASQVPTMLSVLYLIVLALAQLACAQDQPVMLYVRPVATYVPTKGDLFAVSHIIYDSSAKCSNKSKICNLADVPQPLAGHGDLADSVSYLRNASLGANSTGATRKVLLAVGGPSMDFCSGPTFLLTML